MKAQIIGVVVGFFILIVCIAALCVDPSAIGGM